MFKVSRSINTDLAINPNHHNNHHFPFHFLVKCGRKFVSLMGTYHCHCQGEAFFMHRGDPVRVSVNSRMMIDADFFWKMNPNYSRPRADTVTPNSGLSPPPGYWPFGSQVKSDGVEPYDLKEDDFLICCPTVLGFSFDEKLWAEFSVDGIEDIKWSSSPYSCLSISDQQRDVIIALVEARNDPSVVFDDFVAGKGKGVNMLLHGLLGVGKTLTAVAVSEHLKRPLYLISVGELPIVAADLEHQLTRIFKTASHWNAILLLDEADVFLERRSSDDLTRP
ncbi:hypothetical protein BJ875DRAFT_388912 [Amylocarpus encephaloides]|uniref:ATPase AAA-type core domain-containing protein n=1 Tax=Amylocarpus encephaloides TaxID=45428 RepID=A0A9P8BZK9_9HELO|nr:hypothetical protein BJ875DRAFT_388912 [Amylocarpus encephaloides]